MPGNGWHTPKRRITKLLVLFHEKACPGPQAFKKPLELLVHLVVPWHLPVSLLDFLHHVDDLAQDTVECGGRLVRWWRVSRRTGPFQEEVRLLNEFMQTHSIDAAKVSAADGGSPMLRMIMISTVGAPSRTGRYVASQVQARAILRSARLFDDLRSGARRA